MKQITLLCLSILLVTNSFAQSDANYSDEKGLKQGFWITVDSAKKKVYEGHFVDDIPVGTFTYYYSIGTKKSETTFFEQGKVAYSKMYDLGGTLIGEGKYVNQQKDSIWKFYAGGDVLVSEDNYVNGVKDGISTVYYPNGETVETKTWVNGIAEGPCKKYFNNGALRYDGQYVNNLVDGQLTFYFANGKVYAKGKYVKDLKDGDWIYNNKEGLFDRKEVYANGRLLSEDLNIVTKEQQDAERLKYQEQSERENRNNTHLAPK